MSERRQAWAAACFDATRRLETASDDPESSIVVSLTQREAYLISSVLLMSLANGLPDAGATKLLDRITECLGDRGRSADTADALVCGECGVISEAEAPGWRAYLDVGGETAIVCPECAKRELDRG